MKTRSPGTLPLAFLALACSTLPVASQEIDWERARELHRRDAQGQALSEDEREFLLRARALRQQGARAAQQGRVPAPSTGLIPLSDGGREAPAYQGQDSGLYGGGSNRPPAPHQAAALKALANFQTRDATGTQSPEGQVALLSISMSNATQEFSAFKQLADASPLKSPHVLIVDGAQGGQAMAEWSPPDARPWQVAEDRLAAAGASPAQVQAAWVKLANKVPSGQLEEHARKLEADTLKVLQNARDRFPNLQIAYLSSRTYGGYARSNLNPEPYAYEGAFAARWLIQRQIEGDPELNFDPAKGEVKAPLLLWGPYLWADGERGRALDDLVWTREDFVADGVHPSPSGRRKVAQLLLDFFAGDELANPWFNPSQ
jgi:lysophospholipase L1-like esterase